MSSYYKSSKIHYIGMYTKYIAYEIYLDQKHHRSHKNTVEQICNTCLNSDWVLTDEEKELMLKNALNFAKSEYKISL